MKNFKFKIDWWIFVIGALVSSLFVLQHLTDASGGFFWALGKELMFWVLMGAGIFIFRAILLGNDLKPDKEMCGVISYTLGGFLTSLSWLSFHYFI